MKLFLPFLLTGIVSAQQCVEVQLVKPMIVEAERVDELFPYDDEPEEEYFEKIGDGWTAGSTKGGERIGTWWHYQDEDNWKKVTYVEGQVVKWQRLIAGRRLFEMSYNYTTIDWHILRIKVYELDWNKDKTLDWKLIEELTNYEVINEHGHFNNADGTPSKSRTNFGDKYEYGDKFERSIMGVPLTNE